MFDLRFNSHSKSLEFLRKSLAIVGVLLIFGGSKGKASDYGPWACKVNCMVEREDVVNKNLCFGPKVKYEEWNYEGPVGSCDYTRKITYRSKIGSSNWACIGLSEFVIPCVGDVTAYSLRDGAALRAIKSCEQDGGKVTGSPKCHREDCNARNGIDCGDDI